MFQVKSYEAHVGSCLPCDFAMVAGAGIATVGAGSLLSADASQITESKFFIPGVVAASALAGYFLAKYTCGCG